MRILVNILIIAAFFRSAFAQEPEETENKIGFRSEWYGGVHLNTSGWGGELTRSKFRTYKKYDLFTLNISSLRHVKEFRIRNQIVPNARSFKYGKINTVLTTRLSYGRRYMLYEKFREKGVEIYFIGQAGLNVALLKPIYLEIVKFDQDGKPLPIRVDERYDTDIHNDQNIFGKSSSLKGIGESKFNFGGYAKTGFMFEFADNREKILALETGVMLDFFPKKLVILDSELNPQLFFNIYLNLVFGKKYYD